jgi:hypothetical protein
MRRGLNDHAAQGNEMKRVFMFLTIVFALSGPRLDAQDVPRVEGFGGFSMLVPNVDRSFRTTNYGGRQA